MENSNLNDILGAQFLANHHRNEAYEAFMRLVQNTDEEALTGIQSAALQAWLGAKAAAAKFHARSVECLLEHVVSSGTANDVRIDLDAEPVAVVDEDTQGWLEAAAAELNLSSALSILNLCNGPSTDLGRFMGQGLLAINDPFVKRSEDDVTSFDILRVAADADALLQSSVGLDMLNRFTNYVMNVTFREPGVVAGLAYTFDLATDDESGAKAEGPVRGVQVFQTAGGNGDQAIETLTALNQDALERELIQGAWGLIRWEGEDQFSILLDTNGRSVTTRWTLTAPEAEGERGVFERNAAGVSFVDDGSFGVMEFVSGPEAPVASAADSE
jgi:hypothetical protein